MTALAEAGPVAILEPAPFARFNLRVGRADLGAASEAFGVALPERIGGWAASGDREALCLGPDEWSLSALEADREAIVAAFATLTVPHSLVDVSDRDAAIEVDGPEADTVLAAGVPLDLAELAPGSGTRTVFDGVTVVLRRAPSGRVRVEALRTMMPHVLHALHLTNAELAAGL